MRKAGQEAVLLLCRKEEYMKNPCVPKLAAANKKQPHLFVT